MKSLSYFLNNSKLMRILLLNIFLFTFHIHCINFLEKSVLRKFNKERMGLNMIKNVSDYEHPKILSETPIIINGNSYTSSSTPINQGHSVYVIII